MENPPPVAASVEPSPDIVRIGPYAPWWHTLLLVLWIAFTSWSTATALTSGTLPQRAMTSRYVETIVMQLLVVLYVRWGLHLRGHRLRDILGRTWHRFEDALLDVAIAAGFWLVSIAALGALQKLLGMVSQQDLKDRINSLSLLAPKSGRELALFFCVTITAGFCEEIIFRGYLQRQFIFYTQTYTQKWTRGPWAGILLSAALFGLAHGYQGPRLMIVLACYGALFGALAQLRGSLLPGMIAHAWQDSLTGALLYFAKYLPK